MAEEAAQNASLSAAVVVVKIAKCQYLDRFE